MLVHHHLVSSYRHEGLDEGVKATGLTRPELIAALVYHDQSTGWDVGKRIASRLDQ